MSAQLISIDPDLTNRWPRIRNSLRVDPAGNVDSDFIGWSWYTGRRLSTAELATAYEEWADFYEWYLVHRTNQLADAPGLRRWMAQWTENMAYCCRRSAARARGEDPGQWIPQYERRPDLTD